MYVYCLMLIFIDLYVVILKKVKKDLIYYFVFSILILLLLVYVYVCFYVNMGFI